jgi:hypothetical protein
LGTDPKKHACYDIDVEVDDPVRDTMRTFLSPQNTHELEELDGKVITIYHKTVLFNVFSFRFFNILIVSIN